MYGGSYGGSIVIKNNSEGLYFDILDNVYDSFLLKEKTDDIIGYEYVDNTYYLWNNHNYYYINLTRDIQITNHEGQYWGYSRYCANLKKATKWYKYCTNEGDWKWIAVTDNKTYTHLTGTSIFNIDGNEIHFMLEYYLERDWDEILIKSTISNQGDTDYVDSRITMTNYDIRINTSYENDTLEVSLMQGKKSYDLSDPYLSLSLDQNDLAGRIFELWDRPDEQFAKTRWDENYFLNDKIKPMNYTIDVLHDGELYNAPVILTFETGSLDKGSVATTSIWWIDATPGPNIFEYDPYESSDPIDEGETIIFYANATSSELYQYRLVICDSATTSCSCAKTTGFGTCEGGTKICESVSLVDSGIETSCSHDTTGESGDIDWEAYTCNMNTDSYGPNIVNSPYTINSTYPQYSLNQTNSTEAGTDVLFSLYWIDNALAGYIFSFDNGTGTFVNDTYVVMTGTGNWSNVSKWINSTEGATIQWQVYTNDTAGAMNVSKDYSFNTHIVYPKITVQSPTNKSYDTDSVWANLSLDEDGSWCGYSLDGGINITMSNSSGNWNSLVEGLSESNHNITYSCNDTSGNMNASAVTVYFTVDTIKPNIYVLSPDNLTYNNTVIDLNVSSDEIIDTWWYSLNDTTNIIFSPNTTITISPGQNNITIYANDTAGNLNSTIIFFSLNTSLNVALVEPSTDFPTNIVQNITFMINATVVCKVSDCGDVSATVRYNKTSANPDTSVSTTSGAEPLFIDEVIPLSTKSCPTNPLSENEYCNITWIINATDTTFSTWKIDVNFSSDSGRTTPNNTLSSTIVIASCFVDITVGWASIDFTAPLSPNTYENPALGNNENLYNITINDGSCNTDMYIKGTDLVDNVDGHVLAIGNLAWNNVSDLYDTSYNMTEIYTPLMLDVAPLENITTWYWINVPPIFAANYTGTVYLQGVKNGNTPP